MWRFDPVNIAFYFITEILPLIAAGVIGYALGASI